MVEKDMITAPLISICIPIYNGSRYLEACMDSVLRQGIESYEIIVVDDGSTDNSVELILSYQKQNPKIKLYRNESNLGLVGNWNRCLELAHGEWIKFVFQDDVLEDGCINLMLKAANTNSFVVCDRKFIFDETVDTDFKNYYLTKLLRLATILQTSQTVNISKKSISKLVAKNIYLNFIGEPTAVLFKRSLIQAHGFFSAELYQICDLEYWLRLTTQHGLTFIPKKLVQFRIHADSTTTKNIRTEKNFKANYFDVVILAHELVYAKSYESFRSYLSSFEKSKLQFFIKLKMYEAKLAAKANKNVDLSIFEALVNKYPKLKSSLHPSLSVKIIHQLMLLKRKL